jgi:hypothetical protein
MVRRLQRGHAMSAPVIARRDWLGFLSALYLRVCFCTVDRLDDCRRDVLLGRILLRIRAEGQGADFERA